MSEKVVTAKDVLLGAANLLEKRGWTTGVFTNYRGECCALGAITRSHDGILPWSTELDIAKNDAERVLTKVVGSIPWWNDAPGRTKEEVIAKLREVAATLDQESQNG